MRKKYQRKSNIPSYQPGGKQKATTVDFNSPDLPDYYKATVVRNPNKVPTETIDGVTYEISRLGTLHPLGSLAPTEFGAVKKDAPMLKTERGDLQTYEVGQNKIDPNRSVQSLFELNRGWIVNEKGDRVKRAKIGDYSKYYQDGGENTMQNQYSKTMFPNLGKEIAYPIIKIEKTNQDGVDGYRQYYTDPSLPDADFSFLSETDYMRKKNSKAGDRDFEPYLNMYLNKTGNREGRIVSYSDGGEYLPKYQFGVDNQSPFSDYNLNNYLKPKPQSSTPGKELWANPYAPNNAPNIGELSMQQPWSPSQIGQIPNVNFGKQNTNSFNFPTYKQTGVKLDPNDKAVWDRTFKSQNQPDNTNIIQLTPEQMNSGFDLNDETWLNEQRDSERQNEFTANKETLDRNLSNLTQEERDTLERQRTGVDTTNLPQGSSSGQFSPYQFVNPYSGVDLNTAAGILGSSIESGNTFGTVMSGLKLGTGLARNFLGGMGQQRVADRANQRMAEDTRDSMTRTNRPNTLREEGWNEGTGRFYGQDGGEMPQEQGSQEEQMVMQVAEALQQGIPPEEVLQQLMQMGLDEAQATQLIQMVMQQLQGQAPQQEMKCGGKKYKDGGEYLEMLKNKRIKNYTFNSETNSYDIEFED
jgi:hypothetical protein